MMPSKSTMGLVEAGSNLGRVLVVDEDASLRAAFATRLRRNGYDVVEAAGRQEAQRAVACGPLDVAFLDVQADDGDGFDLLRFLRAQAPPVPAFMVSGNATVDVAVRAMKHGAEDFLTKPLSPKRVDEIVESAVARRRREAARERAAASVSQTVRSPAMALLEERLGRLRSADCSVLILGETGTGKSVLARRLHAIGARADGPFVDINCAGLTKDLAESELFGHERGSFTGAHVAKTGLFDAANGGTLFLDEIGDIDAHVQPKILKVLEEKRFRRMGDVRERSVDVRLIAATHRDLIAMMSSSGFRADLFYRISTVTLTVPALRERREDILPLTATLLAQSNGGAPVPLTRDAEERLVGYSWPGNIRELKNVLERARLMRRGTAIAAADLLFDLSDRSEVSSPEVPPSTSMRLLGLEAGDATSAEIEREHIRLALAAENGRVEAAARRLGVPRSTLYWKLKNYGISTGAPRSKRNGTSDT